MTYPVKLLERISQIPSFLISNFNLKASHAKYSFSGLNNHSHNAILTGLHQHEF